MLRPLHSSCVRMLAVAATGLTTGCEPPTARGPGPLDRIVLPDGQFLAATVGTQLPLRVRALDADDRPVKGQTVTFEVVAGGGTVLAGTAVSDHDGVALDQWTLGTAAADTQRVEVRAVDPVTGAERVYAVFHAVGTAALPAVLQPLDSVRYGVPDAALADSVAVQVSDAYGNPVPDAPVAWTVRAGGGSVSPTESRTGPDGVARAAWTLGASAAEQRASAAVGQGRTEIVAVALTRENASLWPFGILPETALAGETVTMRMRLRVWLDGTARYPAGVPVDFSSTAEHTVIVPERALTDSQGVATVQWTLASWFGGQDLVGRVGGISRSIRVETYRPGVPWRIRPIVSLLLESGEPSRVWAYVEDRGGTHLPDAQVTWSVWEGNATIEPTTTRSAEPTSVTWWGQQWERVSISASSPGAQNAGVTATLFPAPAKRLEATPRAITVRRGEFRVLTLHGFNRYGTPACVPNVYITSADPSVATAKWNASDCEWAHFWVSGHHPGDTRLTFTHLHVEPLEVEVHVEP